MHYLEGDDLLDWKDGAEQNHNMSRACLLRTEQRHERKRGLLPERFLTTQLATLQPLTDSITCDGTVCPNEVCGHLGYVMLFSVPQR